MRMQTYIVLGVMVEHWRLAVAAQCVPMLLTAADVSFRHALGTASPQASQQQANPA